MPTIFVVGAACGGAVIGVCSLVPRVADEAREAWRRVSSDQPWPVAAAPSSGSTWPYHNRWAVGDVFRRYGQNWDDWASWAGEPPIRAADWALRPENDPGRLAREALGLLIVGFLSRVCLKFCDDRAATR